MPIPNHIAKISIFTIKLPSLWYSVRIDFEPNLIKIAQNNTCLSIIIRHPPLGGTCKIVMESKLNRFVLATLLSLLPLGSYRLSAAESDPLVIDDSYDSPAKVVFEPKMVLEPNVSSPRFQMGFDTDLRHDSNILLAPDGFEQEGMTYTFSPDFLFRVIGDDFTEHMLVVGYGNTVYYDDFSRDTRVNHDADVVYRWDSGRTEVTLAGHYTHVEGNNGRDFGKVGEALYLREERRARSDRFHVALDIDYELTSMLDAEFELGFIDASFDNLNDYSSVGGQFALMYGGQDAITRIGPYVGFERVDGTNHPSQDAFQAGGRVDWRYSALTNFFAQIGVDSRDYNGMGVAGSTEEVVWAAGVNWQPDEMLSAALGVDRRVVPSLANGGQNNTVSSVTAAIRKELLIHYFTRVVGAYSWADYNATLRGVTTNRQDDYYNAYVEFGRDLADYGEVSVFYNFLENDSNLALQSFENHTVGLKMSVDF